MIRKNQLITTIFAITCFVILYQYMYAKNTAQGINFVPANGFVPNEKTAIKVAEAIWVPIYGTQVLNKKPYEAELKGDTVWVIQGTLPETDLGGVPYIEIRKSDCKILKVSHGK